jgi:putative transposase
MQRRMAYRFRLRPTLAQRVSMARFAGCRRWVWNAGLALQKSRLDSGEKLLGYGALCKELTRWRNAPETSWLAGAPVHTQQQVLRDLGRALFDAFDKKQAHKQFPVFKKKGRGDSFRFPDPKQFELDQANQRIRLPKLGWVRYRGSRPIEGTPRQVTVSQDALGWHVSIQVEQAVAEPPVHPSTSEIGLDLGISRFVTLSDGTYLEPRNAHRRSARRLARLQRQLARKKKFSSNWMKQKRRIQRLQARIARQRRDFLHKASHVISKNHAIIVMEDLAVRNMSRSARGTAEEPGRRVRQKAGLNRAILDQAWGEFARQLKYKSEWRGGTLIRVDPANTSQRCPRCPEVHPDNRKTQSVFRCISCGHTDNADVNAAINILAAGRVATACGGLPGVAGPVKQEPARTAA